MVRELGSAIYVQADLADDADRVRLVREAVAAWGRLDVLINNAGISRVIPHADLVAATPAVWQELQEVNVIAPFRLIAGKRIEEHFGWGKTIGRIRQTVHRGIRRVDQHFKLTMVASNLTRMARMPGVVLQGATR
ncbi:hypothetical protein R69749_08411 [Paraburkholderia domus]|nr:hypothetical protein R69749_08411 [Paraburkholderia domus]